MTRINTNVASLVAQNTLGRSNADLSQALTRLSTGLRINTGKDDPAGLIASENLRSDITAIRRAISNTDRANQVIATADSALGQVSSLLNDIRGLVTESANTGALSNEQISANQLQLDSSLAALNRIAQTTTFQGRRLLDGSLDFITTAGTNFSNIVDLKVDQANLGSTSSVSVNINVTTAATQAQVDVANVPASTTAVAATDDLIISTAAVTGVTEVLSTGTFTAGTVGSDTITVTGVSGTTSGGTNGDGIDVIISDGNGTPTGVDSILYDSGANTITIVADITGGVGSDDIAAAIDGLAEFTSSSDATNNLIGADATTNTNVTSGGVDEVTAVVAGDDEITITAAATGTVANGVTVTVVEAAATGTTPTAAIVSGNIVVTVDDTAATSITDIATAIDGLADYSATLSATAGDGIYTGASETAPAAATLAGGVGTGGITDAVVLELAGSNGAEVLSFGANTSLTELVSGINLVSDATGVTAVANGTTLELVSSAFGTESLVDLRVISEGAGSTPSGTFTTGVQQGERQVGTNIVASVNGVAATGNGNELSINTATLDVTATIASSTTGAIAFTITGGGALFQLGPDVVSNQQARLGVGSVNTARLGGVSGKLFQLGTGGDSELSSTNLDNAAKIVEEAIDEVTSLRGRLGAFQRTTLETNKQALNDTLVNLTAAESSIRDADFAKESAALTRAQILVQSGTTVLQISNQNPQNVLALLR